MLLIGGEQRLRMFAGAKMDVVTYWDPERDDIGDANKGSRQMIRSVCKFDPIEALVGVHSVLAALEEYNRGA
eukprot:9901401-Lingulodinium_polyedra.AAC.1